MLGDQPQQANHPAGRRESAPLPISQRGHGGIDTRSKFRLGQAGFLTCLAQQYLLRRCDASYSDLGLDETCRWRFLQGDSTLNHGNQINNLQVDKSSGLQKRLAVERRFGCLNR